MTDPITRLNAALEGRYAIERELGVNGSRSFASGWGTNDRPHHSPERRPGRPLRHRA